MVTVHSKFDQGLAVSRVQLRLGEVDVSLIVIRHVKGPVGADRLCAPGLRGFQMPQGVVQRLVIPAVTDAPLFLELIRPFQVEKADVVIGNSELMIQLDRSLI